MTYEPKSGKAPDDATAEQAWTEIMRIAERHALIVDAYGGVATLAVPEEQRKAGLREKVLRMGLFELEAEPPADPRQTSLLEEAAPAAEETTP
jgi:hypothetical protein